MTEEIIIDCAFYKDGVCASPINKTCEYCKNIDVSKCYHKQLKRSEQENKELKEAYNEISNNSEILHENNCLRIANAKLSEDLWQHGISMREWRKQSINYRSALETIQRMILSAWEQGKYLDGGLYNDLINEFAKINEVLK